MEMLIKQGFLFVRVMTGEITDGNIIPHKHGPSGAETSALCLLAVALHFVLFFYPTRQKRPLKAEKVIFWFMSLHCLVTFPANVHNHLPTLNRKTQISNHQKEMINGFIKRLKNRESLWRRIKKICGEISMNAAREMPLLLADRRGRWATGSRITQLRNLAISKCCVFGGHEQRIVSNLSDFMTRCIQSACLCHILFLQKK